MELINHHVHTTGSDGKLSPEETVNLAIEKGLSFICFTDHYPYPPNYRTWGIDFHSEKYYKEILKTIKKYKDKIEISFGAEFNWVPNEVEWTGKQIQKRDYDYVLGAVHTLEAKNIRALCDSEENFMQMIYEFGNIKDLVREYYKQVTLMAKSDLFDCIAHFDLIKLYNENSKYFNENEKWYKEEILKALDEIKKHNLIIEINTSGLRRKVKEIYPSFWILLEIKKRNIPITISTDAHYSEDMDRAIKEAIELAKKAGYDHIIKFKNRKQIKVEI